MLGAINSTRSHRSPQHGNQFSISSAWSSRSSPRAGRGAPPCVARGRAGGSHHPPYPWSRRTANRLRLPLRAPGRFSGSRAPATLVRDCYTAT